jgi:UDP-2-acetamido-2-deoxy-ribo-hexuluronate aminotransferase
MRTIQMVDLQGQYTRLKNEIDSAMSEVLDKTQFIQGPQVKQFEQSLAEYCRIPHVISCANGTDAILLALLALDLEPGSEIITPSFSYAAFTEMVLLAGHKPVFVEVNPDTFLIDPAEIEALITPKTKVIAPVHLYGQVADMEKIEAIAQKHHLYIIEDNAQAIGADYIYSDGRKKKSGTMGHISTTSFFPSKNLGCYGDGGAVMTNDEKLAEKLRMLSNHGQRQKYHHEIVGMNSRLDTLQAAVLQVKLAHLDAFTKARNTVAGFYDERLKAVSGIKIPARSDNSSHVFHQYTITLENEDVRTRLKQHLMEAGIPTMIYYPIPLHMQNAYKQDISLKQTEQLCQTVLSLPVSTEMVAEQLDYICSKIEDFFKREN